MNALNNSMGHDVIWTMFPRVHVMKTIIATLLCLCCTCTRIAAQPFAGAGIILSAQAQGGIATTGDPSTPQNGLGGIAVGISVTGGVHISPNTAVQVEFSIPARFTELQIANRLEQLNAHRDVILSGLFTLRVRTSGPLLVGGVSFVREDTRRQVAFRNIATGLYGPFGPAQSVTRDALGFTGGVDVPIGINAHLFVLPQLRVHWIGRAAINENGNATQGLSAFVWRPAASLLVKF